jgi:sulfopyruvate decarboxylase subunit alpha
MSASASREAAAPLWARGVCAGLEAIGARDIVYVPDNPLSHVIGLLERAPDVRAILATREEEAFGIAAGLYLGGARPAVLLQSSGLGNSLNAITSLLLPYQVPVVAIVSMRGGPGEWNAAQTPMGRAVAPMLDAIGIQHVTPARDDQVEEAVTLAGRLAFGTRTMAACLLPYSVARGVRPPARGSGSRA